MTILLTLAKNDRLPLAAVAIIAGLTLAPWNAGTLTAEEPALSYSQWVTRCLSTPANRTLNGQVPPHNRLPLKNFQVVDQLAKKMLATARQGSLADSTRWVGAGPDPSKFLDTERSYYTRDPIPFQPFAQKLRIEPGAEIVFHGDLHGDIRSFISTLQWLNQNGRMEGFKLKGRKTYLLFLGDYTDRGSYGVEVIYTLLRLKLANPDRVFMARGNHEDFQLTAAYGFLREGQLKYGQSFSPLAIWRNFDFLPVVIYVGAGANFVQCNHGGMEPGYDPQQLLTSSGEERFQLLGELKQKEFMKRHPAWARSVDTASLRMAENRFMDFTPQTPTAPAPIGFMWNDYSLFSSEPALAFNQDRLAFIFGQSSTRFLLAAASSDKARLRAVFRAHQHASLPNPMMNRLVASKGAFRHWQAQDRAQLAASDRTKLKEVVDTGMQRSIPDGSVWTFNVSPDSVYGSGNNYSFDTIGILKTATAFKDWRLSVINVPVKIP